MIREISKRLTEYLIKEDVIEFTSKEVYNYCFESTLVVLLSYTVLLLLSLMFSEFISTFIFVAFFTLFRKTSGGFHAKNYTICGIISLISYLFFLFILKNMTFLFNYNSLIMIISLAIIFVLSPISDKNKPFSYKQYRLFKIISRSFSISFVMITIIIQLQGRYDLITSKFYFSSCYGVLLVALSLLMSKFERRYKNEKEP